MQTCLWHDQYDQFYRFEGYLCRIEWFLSQVHSLKPAWVNICCYCKATTAGFQCQKDKASMLNSYYHHNFHFIAAVSGSGIKYKLSLIAAKTLF